MADGFIRRWARRKTESVAQDDALATESYGGHGQERPVQEPASSLPTMCDVRMLGIDSDFSPFMAKGVDRQVRRAALKTLFSDPHFQVMDGLDIYIDDYNRPSPVSPEMLAALAHARSTLEPRPLYQVEEPEEQEQEQEHEASIADGVNDPAAEEAVEDPQTLQDMEQPAIACAASPDQPTYTASSLP